MNCSLKIISMNANGIASNMWSCFTQLAESKNDIILLQETKITNPETDRKLHSFGKHSSMVLHTQMQSQLQGQAERPSCFLPTLRL